MLISTMRFPLSTGSSEHVQLGWIMKQRYGEQGWRSGESARFPPMWPGFDSARYHMWVEFVVGSRPCSEGFSPGSPVFLPPQKPTLPNSNSIGNSRATGLSVARLLCATLVKHSWFGFLGKLIGFKSTT